MDSTNKAPTASTNKAPTATGRRRRNPRAPRRASAGTAVARGTAAGALCLGILLSCAAAFAPVRTATGDPARSRAMAMARGRNGCAATTELYGLVEEDESPDEPDDEDDLSKFDPAMAAQIRKARKLLGDAKKTQKAKEEAAARAEAADDDNDDSGETKAPQDEGTKPSKEAAAPLPFFAAKETNSRKIKSKTDSGEIIADGETMTALSDSEPWARRSLAQMFERENRLDYDGNEVEEPMEGTKGLADRDVAASIYNMRKKMRTEDFMNVFDKRNFFIGDVD